LHPDRCLITNEEAYSGNASAIVTCGNTDQGARWERELTVTPGGFYLIGAHAQTKNIHGSGYGYLAVYQYDSNGKLLRFIDFAQFWKTTEIGRAHV
jgi:hypothetical protein